jgi:hypothetical protein
VEACFVLVSPGRNLRTGSPSSGYTTASLLRIEGKPVVWQRDSGLYVLETFTIHGALALKRLEDGRKGFRNNTEWQPQTRGIKPKIALLAFPLAAV